MNQLIRIQQLGVVQSLAKIYIFLLRESTEENSNSKKGNDKVLFTVTFYLRNRTRFRKPKLKFL